MVNKSENVAEHLGPCYVARTGNHQRLIIEDATGRTVAVVYDAKDAATLAAAPELRALLERYVARDLQNADTNTDLYEESEAAIAKAGGA